MTRIILSAFLFGVWIQSQYAQQPTIPFENLEHIDAVPDAFQIMQDREGYIWVATNDGIWKFNGYEFEVFRFKPRTSARITLMEDRKGRIWSAGAGTRIDHSNTTKSHFTHSDLPLESSRINVLLDDGKGNIWIGGNKGLQVFSMEDTDTLELLADHPMAKFSKSHGSPYVYCLLQQDEVIWIGTTIGVVLYNVASENISFHNTNASFPSTKVTDIELDLHERVWLAAPSDSARFYVYNNETFNFEPEHAFDQIGKNSFLRFCFDLNDRIWISNYGRGIYAFNLSDFSIHVDPTLNSNISYAKYIRDPVADRIGNVWLPADGVFRFNFDRGFKSFQHTISNNQSVSSIFQGQDFFWAAYRDIGVLKIDHEGESFETFLDHRYQPKFNMSDPITSIIPLEGADLLIGRVGGVHLLDRNSGKIKDYRIGGVVRSLFQDKKKRIWISSQYGLYQFDLDEGIKHHFTLENRFQVAHFFQTIVESPDGKTLWIASDGNGLVKFDTESNKLSSFGSDGSGDGSFPSQKVNDLAIDDHGNLWVGTDVGLVKRNKSTKKFSLYGHQHGIYNEFIASVLIDSQGSIWASTNSGISVFDSDRENFSNFSKSDGLSNSFYYPRVKHKDEDGNLYFGGRNGIDFFHPEEIQYNTYEPRVILNSIELSNGEVIFPEDLSVPTPITLSDDIDFLRIKYVGMDFPAHGNLQYAYRIAGMNDQWQNIGKEREVLLSNLKPGEYTFEVRARDKYNHGIQAALNIPMKVKPPFYVNPIFIAVMAAFILLVLWLIITNREKRIRKKQQSDFETQKRIVELELKSLRSQMNPHFIFNSMNTIQDFILINDKVGAIKYLSKFSRLVRKALNYSSQAKIPLNEELELIKDYLELEQMRFPDKFEYELNISPEVPIHSIEIPPFLIQPLVENSIQHGFNNKQSSGRLSIVMNADAQQLKVEITDNGIGRKASSRLREHIDPDEKGKGLAIVNQRIEMLKELNEAGQLQVIDLIHPNGDAKGTKVILNLSTD